MQSQREIDSTVDLVPVVDGPKNDICLDIFQFHIYMFILQGKALNAVASRNVKVIVVGNPCNTK